MLTWKRTITVVTAVMIAMIPVSAERSYAKSGTIRLAEGNYVKFGSYNGEPIVWKVVQREGGGTSMLLSERILSLKPFDATGDQADDGGNGSRDSKDDSRAYYGSNEWETSSLREWLNSADASVAYSHQTPDNHHVLGNFNEYASESGFLNGFTAEEREAIQPTMVKTMISSLDAFRKHEGTEPHAWNSNAASAVQNVRKAYFRMTTDRVFLPSIEEVKQYLLDKGEDMQRKPTLSAVRKSEYKEASMLNENKPWYYWLRDAYAGDGYGVRIVHPSGEIAAAAAGGGTAGVVPAVRLKADLAVSGGAGTASEPYIVTGTGHGGPSGVYRE